MSNENSSKFLKSGAAGRCTPITKRKKSGRNKAKRRETTKTVEAFPIHSPLCALQNYQAEFERLSHRAT